jgi:hypothetical protein
MYMRTILCSLAAITGLHAAPAEPKADLVLLDNGNVKIGIDRARGASITHLSWAGYPKNTVNIHDPGRLIQQSYYAGKRLDRRAEGQHKAWSPWTWNPIQGGGVGSWAAAPKIEKLPDGTLHSETVPKLWDMPNEEARALMRQWTGFEPGMPDVVVVRCELVASREIGDRWGPARPSPQEVPATYFTRNFDTFKSYLGDGRWRTEPQKIGPPWSKADASRKAMACFNKAGQGIAIFSPNARSWNYGPHAGGKSDDPLAGPCVHIAPVARAKLGPRSIYKYRYWLAVGTETQIAKRLDTLGGKYATDTAELRNP